MADMIPVSAFSEDLLPLREKMEEVYSAPFAREMGIEVDSLSRDEVVLHMDIAPKHINSRGFVHGAVIYGLMDHSLAFAANMNGTAVGQSSNILYHRPVKEGRLVSRTVPVNRSKSLEVYDSKVFCNGKLIASCTLTAFRIGDE